MLIIIRKPTIFTSYDSLCYLMTNGFECANNNTVEPVLWGPMHITWTPAWVQKFSSQAYCKINLHSVDTFFNPSGLDTKFWKHSPFRQKTFKVYLLAPVSLAKKFTLTPLPPAPHLPVLAIFNFYYEIDFIL